ncbi:AfsR/SARP family transcriptional regulator [Kibdelosporangium phytohabitans]|uniref:OmpR/PhoB-type domain-containing protein n=1 Tax=Kibdelosporangium phytohabitans TaxID=860235 RepID=A0A0N9HT92_9PSEU|nr:BTAD domain-containing putative transcriptional regulator [Kibdelosporangium phytohabitans]ALG08298.1 hypothetical protein AOZ06_16510 [Kibdelosporangium phytohabitans]MBE1470677.1 DNA-binding SARP family transcriptional activator [Kibdelosporangium phytohabitans]
MRFRVLGPVEVAGAGGVARLGGAKQVALVSELIMSANRVVPTERIATASWGANPPAGAAAALHTSLSRLRRALADVEDGGEDRVITHSTGYQLRVEPGELDLDEFNDMVAKARATDEPAEAAELFSSALALWRGPALTGVPGELAEAWASGLADLHLEVTEELLECRLACGEHAVVVSELGVLVARNPLRERLRGQLMLALFRVGRQAEALASYRELYGLLADELGIQPTPGLQQLHQRILAGDATLRSIREAQQEDTSAVRPAPIPRQLPANVSGFTGRAGHVQALDDMFESSNIVTVAGVGGVGKTALALHWAHRNAERAPDGQLYLNLRGYASTPPMEPDEALARLLRGLGIGREKLPATPDEQAAMYRSLLADRQMLVVLDNAATADQVRPLLPGSPSCPVVVTSRDDLRGLTAVDGASLLVLDVLAPGESLALLTRIIGAARVEAEPQHAAQLTELCGHLPLALRIAAAHLSSQRYLTIEDYLGELTEGERLTRLAIDEDREVAVRASFDLSYEKLDADTRRMFRLLGAVPGPDTTLPAVAALADLPTRQAARLMDRLVTAHLVEVPAAGRFQQHDLLRLYARERTVDSAQDAEDARHRLFDWYLHTTDAAAEILNPTAVRLPRPPAAAVPLSFTSDTQALAWLDAERANLAAAIHHAADQSLSVAWHLADAVRGYLFFRMAGREWLDLAEAGLRAAVARSEVDGEAAMRHSLAHVHFSLGDYEMALRHGVPAGDHHRRAGNAAAEAEVRKWSGLSCWLSGRFSEALEHLMPARDRYREVGNRSGEANIMNSIGLVYMELGRFHDALAQNEGALAIQLEIGSRFGEGVSHQVIGRAKAALGDYETAIAEQTAALEIYRSIGYRYGEATVMCTITVPYVETARYDEAERYGRDALGLAREIGVPAIQADALNSLAAVDLGLGRYQDALERGTDAVRIAREAQFPRGVIDGLVLLAEAHRRAGRTEEASATVDQAIAEARDRQFAQCEGQALLVLARIELDSGHHAPAAEAAGRALDLHTETGYECGRRQADQFIADLRRRVAPRKNGPAFVED